MTDIAVIILVGQERLHMRRCLERLRPLEPKQVFVVESQPSDGTHEIAVEMGATTVFHEWPGDQAKQFNWAVDNLSITAKWVLRIDADEWLTDELIAEIKRKLPDVDEVVCGIVLKRRHYFFRSWVKRGVYPTRILRLFRVGRAKYADNMLMDEHLIVDGKKIEFDADFVDESLIPFCEWKDKHRGYAKREAKMALTGEVNTNKRLYYKCPPYLRALAYFCYRYIFRLGFLDGYAGWMWHFWQGLWYRCLVDREIGRLRKTKRVAKNVAAKDPTAAADIAVIILVGQEQLHIGRCIERLKALVPRQLFVVESQSGDNTHDIAVEMGATTVFHEWPGCQAQQFNWALDNLPIEAKWILRLDADEYLTEESVEWLRANIDGIREDVSALEFTLERKFSGHVIRHGTNGIKMVRMFRRGQARYSKLLMDEYVVFDGKKMSVPVVFFDDNLCSIEDWKKKHRAYAKREAEVVLSGNVKANRRLYYKCPPYLRAVVYFCIRYFFKLGFLDGVAGWHWHFWQGLWYRWLVDIEIRKASKSDSGV